MPFKRLTLYTDGASRGNPGPAAIGVNILDSGGKTVAVISECLAACTNNQAEYRAVIAGLEKALELGATDVLLCSDSELVMHQLSGKYRVKNEALKPLYDKTAALIRRFHSFTTLCVPREQNREADRLANLAFKGREQPLSTPPSDVRVRPATKADYPAVISIIEELERQHVAAVPEFFSFETYDEQVRDLDEVMAAKDSALLVADMAGTVVGYIHMAVQKRDAHPGIVPGAFVKIRDLAVSSKYHKVGAGTALMQAAEEWTRERGLKTLDLNVWDFNKGAFAFYQKMGFTTASRHMWKYLS
jgi:ribonuclease HI